MNKAPRNVLIFTCMVLLIATYEVKAMRLLGRILVLNLDRGGSRSRVRSISNLVNRGSLPLSESHSTYFRYYKTKLSEIHPFKHLENTSVRFINGLVPTPLVEIEEIEEINPLIEIIQMHMAQPQQVVVISPSIYDVVVVQSTEIIAALKIQAFHRRRKSVVKNQVETFVSTPTTPTTPTITTPQPPPTIATPTPTTPTITTRQPPPTIATPTPTPTTPPGQKQMRGFKKSLFLYGHCLICFILLGFVVTFIYLQKKQKNDIKENKWTLEFEYV